MQSRSIFIQTLSFLNGPIRNRWLYSPEMKVYVRKANRAINGELRQCLDVATVEVEESLRGKGIFSGYLSLLEKKIPRIIYVENAINPKLREFFEKRQGWTKDGVMNFFFIPKGVKDVCL